MASGVKVSKMNFELNPRGNLWFNDETTFGHKLLSKMGWSKGKGLGKNEDGIKENIKISKKDTNTGVGWKNEEIPVAIGCLEYENILQNLQKHFKKDQEISRSNESFDKSLEQRSRSARNHLHYQKFVRVKDLNRYSEKDMKSIFLEKPKKPVREHPTSHLNQTPTFKSQLSINDYFAMKIQKKKDEAAMSNVTNENNLTLKPQPPIENFSKKRKITFESPENETSRKAKLKKKNSDDETASPINSATDKSLESKECGKRKKMKKMKKNKLHLQQLKSCLKSRIGYDLERTRNVSFNEEVSYKMLDTSLELCEEINDVANDDLTMNKVACDDNESTRKEETTASNEERVTLIDSDEEPENNKSNDNNNDNASREEEDLTNEEETEETNELPPQCLDLPKSSGSNFNFWLENQRQASKMKLYKEMMKKIKKNKILRSTNLLDIKGYGNWVL